MVEQQPSQQQYKRIKYNHTIFEIPVRHIDHKDVILLDDIQAVIPKATALFIARSTKLVPFDVADGNNRLSMKRILAALLTEDVYEVYVPPPSPPGDDCNSNNDLQIKLDQLASKVDQLLSLALQQHTLSTSSVSSINYSQHRMHNETTAASPLNHSSPPPAASAAPSTAPRNHHSNQHVTVQARDAEAQEDDDDDDDGSQTQQQDAPPSYETSVYSTIKALNARLLEFESHIPNKHKSPKWLSKRENWVSQVRTAAAAASASTSAHTVGQEQLDRNGSHTNGSHGTSLGQNAAANTSSTENNNNGRHPINQFAMSLIELEMALLWSAVTEDWIQQERDTWINLLGNARSERHLAGALINLERHTLATDSEWTVTREAWVNELLEIMTHFL